VMEGVGGRSTEVAALVLSVCVCILRLDCSAFVITLRPTGGGVTVLSFTCDAGRGAQAKRGLPSSKRTETEPKGSTLFVSDMCTHLYNAVRPPLEASCQTTELSVVMSTIPP
jgi:hypothetical protein